MFHVGEVRWVVREGAVCEYRRKTGAECGKCREGWGEWRRGELWRVRWWRGDVIGQEVKQRYNVTADWG